MQSLLMKVLLDNPKLFNLLNASNQSEFPHFLIGPRRGTLSPWSSKTSEIIQNVGITGVQSIEKYFGYFVDGATEISELVLTNLFDRMTQEVFYTPEDLSNTAMAPNRRPLQLLIFLSLPMRLLIRQT